MTAADLRVTSDWLGLREPADAAARSTELVDLLSSFFDGADGPSTTREHLGGRRVPVTPLVVHDLGCGSGSMGRWLAPMLRGPQRWVLHDRDPDLLRVAAADPPSAAADGAAVTVETRQGDLRRLGRGDLAGASLVTASALLDMFTADEVAGFVRTCVTAACPALVTLSVTGHVRLTPSDPLDAEIEAAFNDHQRRTVDGRTLLGPDAVAIAVGLFRTHGWRVEASLSPWYLTTRHPELAAEWMDGWVGAAIEQQPGLEEAGAHYLARRGRDLTNDLNVTVEHLDLLALPPGSGK